MIQRFLLISFLLVAASAFATAQARISVATESTVDGETFLLGQIARISTTSADAKRLSEISLGYSPGVGLTREVSIASIQLSLKAAGFSEADTAIIAPTKITVRRAAQTVDGRQLRDSVEAAIRKQFEGTGTECEIVRIDILEPPMVPVGRVEIKPTISGVRNFVERVPVPLEIRVDGRLVRTMTATAEIALYADVAVTVRDIAANQPVTQTDVRIERTRLERSPASYIRDTSQLRSVQAVRPVMAGKPLMADSIMPATVIKLGDMVRIEAQTGRVRIFVNGEARANGRIGDRISVKNKDTGFVVQAIVVDQGLVKVVI